MTAKFHLKGLNGLRGIGAACVVITHTSIPGYGLNAWLPIQLANYYVTIFFTLSGFLITYLLFNEKKIRPVSIRNFYYRRMLRIWPMYFAYLIIAVIVIYFQTPENLPGSLPYYLFFAANVPRLLHNHLPYLAHYWTLGVEEQFYIFWPWIIKKSKNILRVIVIFTVLFLVIKGVVRLFFYDQQHPLPLAILFVNRFECMSIGGIAAVLCLKKNDLFIRITTHRFTEIACWTCFLLMAANRFFISYFFNEDIAALIAVCLIMNLAFNNRAIVSLENRFFDFLGKISYGMYVIHPLLVLGIHWLMGPVTGGSVGPYILLLASVLLTTILISGLSYEFFEKKFLRLKDKFSTVKTVA
jgi:peptidoglycan/LPS O-acetylase OafA/YrhL